MSKEDRPEAVARIVSDMVKDCSADMTAEEKKGLVAAVVKAAQEPPGEKKGS